MPLYLGNKLISGMGLPGEAGKSAYQIAQEAGYVGTETEFAELLANAATTDYVDEAIGKIPTPDVSGQIEEHNTDENAHADIRTAVGNAQTAANNANTAAGTAQSTANAAQTAANNAMTAAQNAQSTADSKAPMYTYGTEDLEAGVTSLPPNTLHFVYE